MGSWFHQFDCKFLISMFPEAEGNDEVEVKQNSLLPAVPVIKWFFFVVVFFFVVFPPYSKLERNCEKIPCFTPAGPQIYGGF